MGRYEVEIERVVIDHHFVDAEDEDDAMEVAMAQSELDAEFREETDPLESLVVGVNEVTE